MFLQIVENWLLFGLFLVSGLATWALDCHRDSVSHKEYLGTPHFTNHWRVWRAGLYFTTAALVSFGLFLAFLTHAGL